MRALSSVASTTADCTPPAVSPLFSAASIKSGAVTAVVNSFLWGPGALLSGGLAFNPAYGIGLTGLIAVHEGGHALACKYYGIPSEAPIFAGLLAFVKHDVSPNAHQDAMVALAGPVVGSIGALGCAVAGYGMESPVLMDLGELGLIMNLVNLIPIKPLDGGSIARAISPAVTVAAAGLGCAGLAALMWNGYSLDQFGLTQAVCTACFYTELSLIVGAGSLAAYQIVCKAEAMSSSYYQIGVRRKAGLSAAYIGTIGAIVAAYALIDFAIDRREEQEFNQALELMKVGQFEEAKAIYLKSVERMESKSIEKNANYWSQVTWQSSR